MTMYMEGIKMKKGSLPADRYGIPEYLLISGTYFNIIIGEADEKLEAKDVVGLMDPSLATISIVSGYAEAVTKRILIHEVLHALIDVVRILDFNDLDEEKLMNALEVPFLCFLAENDLSFFKTLSPEDKRKMERDKYFTEQAKNNLLK